MAGDGWRSGPPGQPGPAERPTAGESESGTTVGNDDPDPAQQSPLTAVMTAAKNANFNEICCTNRYVSKLE